MKSIEDHLEKTLKRLLGKQVPVTKGPFMDTKLTGIHPEVFLHAKKYIDFDGIMPDGARTTRRPVDGPATFKGFIDERPGRIKLIITCVSGNYSLLQDICSLISPAVLNALQTLPKIPMGNLPNKSTEFRFEDFVSTLHKAKLKAVSSNELSYFKGKLTFYLNGFMHVRVTKKGGFRSKSVTASKIKTPKKRAPKKTSGPGKINKPKK